jgi:hypothetical protein
LNHTIKSAGNNASGGLPGSRNLAIEKGVDGFAARAKRKTVMAALQPQLPSAKKSR